MSYLLHISTYLTVFIIPFSCDCNLYSHIYFIDHKGEVLFENVWANDQKIGLRFQAPRFVEFHDGSFESLLISRSSPVCLPFDSFGLHPLPIYISI